MLNTPAGTMSWGASATERMRNIAASIKPGPASLAFALSVIFTMLSAQSFDPRMFWDRMDADTDRKDPPA